MEFLIKVHTHWLVDVAIVPPCEVEDLLSAGWTRPHFVLQSKSFDFDVSTMTFNEFLAESAEIIEEHRRRRE